MRIDSFNSLLQSTLPKRVETVSEAIAEFLEQTSIHSTQTGRDVAAAFSERSIKHFNPLYPNG